MFSGILSLARAQISSVSVSASLFSEQLGNARIATLRVEQSSCLMCNVVSKNTNVLVFQDLLHYCQDVYPGFPGRFRVRRKPRETQIIARAHIFNVSVHASLLSGQLGNVTVATLHIEQSPRLICNIL